MCIRDRNCSGFERSISLMMLQLGIMAISSSGTRWAAQITPGLPLSGVQFLPTLKSSRTHTPSGSAIVRHSDSGPQEGRNPYFSMSEVMRVRASSAVLDVYKRQGYNFAWTRCGTVDRTNPCSFPLVFSRVDWIPGRWCDAPTGPLTLLRNRFQTGHICWNVMPVSYTHLDVYKRQRQILDGVPARNVEGRIGGEPKVYLNYHHLQHHGVDPNSCLLYTSSVVYRVKIVWNVPSCLRTIILFQ